MGSRRLALLAAGALAATLASRPAEARFTIGYFEEPTTPRLAELAGAGVNLVVAYLARGNDPRPLLDNAARVGLRVALQVETHAEKNARPDELVRLVQTTRSHPALEAWFAFDEPELRYDRRHAERVIATLRRVDPGRPVLVVHSGDRGAERFADLGDVLGLDYYPVADQPPLAHSLETMVPLAERLVRWGRMRDRKTLFVVQSFNWHDFRKCRACRFPTPAELRYLAYAPLVSGCDGLVFWTRYRTPADEWRKTVAPLIRELASLAPYLERNRSGHTERYGPSVRVRYAAPDVALAVNDSPRATPGLRLKAPPWARQAEVVGEDRILSVREGAILDTFPPYGVHVYRFTDRPDAPR